MPNIDTNPKKEELRDDVTKIAWQPLDTTGLNKRNDFIDQRPNFLHYVNSTKNQPIFKIFFFF